MTDRERADELAEVLGFIAAVVDEADNLPRPSLPGLCRLIGARVAEALALYGTGRDGTDARNGAVDRPG